MPPESSPDTPPRRQGMFAVLAAVACTVFGAKLVVISALGSSMPLKDQWDGEAANLYAPYLKGELSLADLVAPHNQHRILCSRLLTLMHLELGGEWNPRLEMILGAGVHTALITYLAALLMPLVAPRLRMLLACFTALLFAVPIGYENTLWGFQSPVYFTLLFGVAALAAFARAHPFSLRWFGGLTAAVLSYFSFGTGVATLLGGGMLLGVQVIAGARERRVREYAAIVVVLAFAAVAILDLATAKPNSTPVTFIEGLLLLTFSIIVALIPALWYCRYTLTRRPAIGDRAWVFIGIVAWIAIQLALVAYGRGAVVAVRYMDIILLLYPLALVAVLEFVRESDMTRFGRLARAGTVMWVFTVVAAVSFLGYYASLLGAMEWSRSAGQELVNVRAYLATKDADHLRGRGGGNGKFDLAYPDPQRLAALLGDSDVRAILPHALRPADADNRAARSRMLLKGKFDGATSAAVNGLFSLGPALLGLGLSLFFAAGTRGSLLKTAVGRLDSPPTS
ncbi:hypothetical protein MSAS_02930 [Mycobacterium saskatchewanense]|nr:hypothetical protein MSAS_02930 [Mycobacterium saskatchewanense]